MAALERTDYFWRSPLDNARFQQVTDFGGTEQGAAISADGKLVAFLSDRDGPMDVWLTQLGAGQFYNLTRGRFRGLGNPSLRMFGFSPDGIAGDILGARGRRIEFKRHQRLGRADARRAAAAVPGRRGRIRLVA